MLYNHIFNPLALEEYIEATNWYNERSKDTAKRFIDDVEGRVSLICSDPYRYRQTHKAFREISLFTFPYCVVYTIDEPAKVIVISSIYHHKRNPKKKYR